VELHQDAVSLAEPLQEWWKTPTVSVYADGQMSVPSA
jgi:hypothetical protein